MLDELLSAMSAPKRMLWKGAGQLLGQDDVPDTGAGLLGKYAGMNEDDTLTKALGFGVDLFADPMTYLLPAGVGVAGKALRGAAGATAAGAEGVAAFKPLLKNITMFKGVQPVADDAAQWTGKLVNSGAGEPQGKLQQLMGRMQGYLGDPQLKELAGVYSPELGTKVSLANRIPANRHELTHALVDQAAKSGQTEGLPWLMQAPAKLAAGAERTAQGTLAPSFRGGLATLLDEVAAHTLEGRTLPQQMGNAANFLLNPLSPSYYDEFARLSPAVANAYGAVKSAPVWGGVAGAGMGGMAYANQR